MPSDSVAFHWLAPNDLVAINRALVDLTGEPFGLLNQAALEGALARPRHWHEYDGVTSMPVLIAGHVTSIACAHAFLQGNKRTAAVASGLFAAQNGWAFSYDDSGEFADLIYACLADEQAFPALCDFIARVSAPA